MTDRKELTRYALQWLCSDANIDKKLPDTVASFALDHERLEDVRGTMNNENMTVRESVERLVKLEEALSKI